MERLTTFTRKSHIFQNRNYFIFIHSVRLSTVLTLLPGIPSSPGRPGSPLRPVSPYRTDTHSKYIIKVSTAMYGPHPLFLLSFHVRQLFHSYPALRHHDIITTALVKHVCLLIIKCTRMYTCSPGSPFLPGSP